MGTVRVADVNGELFAETILAWDEPTRLLPGILERRLVQALSNLERLVAG